MNFPTTPIIRARDFPLQPNYYKELLAGTRAQRLVKIAGGNYVDASKFQDLSRYQQYVLRVKSIADSRVTHPVLIAESAAYLWGMPLPHIPPVTLQRHAVGARNGKNYRRRVSKLEDLQVVNRLGILLADKVDAAVAACLELPPEWSLVMFDRLLSSRPLLLEEDYTAVTKEHLSQAIARVNIKSKRALLGSIVQQADGRAESPGESRLRWHLLQAGVRDLELQCDIYDDDGFVARVDMLLKALRIVLEFDGRVKYQDKAMLAGRTPGEVVWQEKVREDRLRALGYQVVRIVWADLADPEKLMRKFNAAIQIAQTQFANPRKARSLTGKGSSG